MFEAISETQRGSLADITRHEIDAKINAVEARVDTRVAKFENRIDVFVAQMQVRDEERDKWVAERDKSVAERDKCFIERDKRLEILAKSATGLKSTLWITSISTIVTVMLAFAGMMTALIYATQASHQAIAQSTMQAFQQGQNTSSTKNPS